VQDGTDGTWRKLAEALVAVGALPEPGRWTQLAGGRVNRVWRIDGSRSAALVCKLEVGDAANPLFPNDLGAEATAIRHLAGTGIGPEVTADLPTLVTTPFGRCLLYPFVPGRPWCARRDDPTAVARLLSRLHAQPLPDRAPFRRLPTSGADIVAMAAPMLAALPSRVAERLRRAQPPANDVGPSRRVVLLHGDPVPSNIVVGPDGPRFIDWQCPALGDPAYDAALFLSPAMQTIYGTGPLPTAARAAFLGALAPDLVRRVKEIEPLLRWLLGVFCTFRGHRGSSAHGDAAPLELSAART